MTSAITGSPRIRRIAGTMSIATVVLAVLLFSAGVYVALDMTALYEAIRSLGLADPVGGLAPGLRIVAASLGLPALGLILWSLWNAFWLFRAYGAGEIVSLEIGRRIRRIGITLVAFPLVTTVTNLLTSIVVSWDEPEGQRIMSLSISSEAVIMAITGAILIMVGWSMVEAARIADENRQFV